MAGPYDIYAHLGDSNCSNGGSTLPDGVTRYPPFDFNEAIDTVTHPRLFQYKHDGTVALAADPLDFIGSNTTLHMGALATFARNYVIPNNLAAGRNVLLCPEGWGGTGWYTGQSTGWQPGQGAYEQAVTRINAAVAHDPGNVLKAVLVMNGTNDINIQWPENITWLDFVAVVSNMVDDARSRLTGGANVPFVFCNIPNQLNVYYGYQMKVSVGIAALASYISNCAVIADTSAFTSNLVVNLDGSPITHPNPAWPELDSVYAYFHYDALAQRTQIAPAYWNALNSLEQQP